MCADIIQQVADTVQRAFDDADLQPASCHNLIVEMVGGGLRGVATKAAVARVANVDDLRRNLDPSTSAAIGAALFGSMQFGEPHPDKCLDLVFQDSDAVTQIESLESFRMSGAKSEELEVFDQSLEERDQTERDRQSVKVLFKNTVNSV